jgi:hypothetical protein
MVRPGVGVLGCASISQGAADEEDEHSAASHAGAEAQHGSGGVLARAMVEGRGADSFGEVPGQAAREHGAAEAGLDGEGPRAGAGGGGGGGG